MFLIEGRGGVVRFNAKVINVYEAKRHFYATIYKEKLSRKDYATLSFKDAMAEDVANEHDLASLALQSNHSYATFNLAYASLTMLTIDTLLYYNH
ncbi:hypothetical protein VE00_11168 [Pseudogymnoascus sp. WSF 3629]|nr:hypothetical protein VE00_11168 [Pseudogymnoascus sp. WSF 3629]